MSSNADVESKVAIAFKDAFQALHVAIDPHDVSRMASVVHTCMSQDGRVYHRTEHVFDLFRTAGEDPIATLAGLFHDVVYTQVDDGFSACIASLLMPLIHHNLTTNEYMTASKGEFATLLPSSTSQTSSISASSASRLLVDMVLHVPVFGFTYGQTIPPGAGLNEYLSALVAVLLLATYCSRVQLLQVAMCIEATIPFCGVDAHGTHWTTQLRDRCWHYIREHSIDMSTDQLHDAVHRAVFIANNDVGNFGSEHTRVFLKNTWKL